MERSRKPRNPQFHRTATLGFCTAIHQLRPTCLSQRRKHVGYPVVAKPLFPSGVWGKACITIGRNRRGPRRFLVAQILNLLYRRIVFGQASCRREAQRITSPRYSRMQFCATLVAALPRWELSASRHASPKPTAERFSWDAGARPPPSQPTGVPTGVPTGSAYGGRAPRLNCTVWLGVTGQARLQAIAPHGSTALVASSRWFSVWGLRSRFGKQLDLTQTRGMERKLDARIPGLMQGRSPKAESDSIRRTGDCGGSNFADDASRRSHCSLPGGHWFFAERFPLRFVRKNPVVIIGPCELAGRVFIQHHHAVRMQL